MSESMSAAEYQRGQRNTRHTCPTCGKKHGGRNKYGAVAVIDPETGRRIASKAEHRVLCAMRAKADQEDLIVAIQPRLRVEGGHASFDGALMQVLGGTDIDGWFPAKVKLWDAKGRQTRHGAKTCRQVLDRHKIRVDIMH